MWNFICPIPHRTMQQFQNFSLPNALQLYGFLKTLYGIFKTLLRQFEYTSIYTTFKYTDGKKKRDAQKWTNKMMSFEACFSWFDALMMLNGAFVPK